MTFEDQVHRESGKVRAGTMHVRSSANRCVSRKGPGRGQEGLVEKWRPDMEPWTPQAYELDDRSHSETVGSGGHREWVAKGSFTKQRRLLCQV